MIKYIYIYLATLQGHLEAEGKSIIGHHKPLLYPSLWGQGPKNGYPSSLANPSNKEIIPNLAPNITGHLRFRAILQSQPWTFQDNASIV